MKVIENILFNVLDFLTGQRISSLEDRFTNQQERFDNQNLEMHNNIREIEKTRIQINQILKEIPNLQDNFNQDNRNLLKDLIQFREHFRRFLEFENNLVNQRISAFLTSQAFLVFNYFNVFINYDIDLNISRFNPFDHDIPFINGTNTLKFFILLVLVFIGIQICQYVKAAVKAAVIHRKTLHKQFKKLYEQSGFELVHEMLGVYEEYFPEMRFRSYDKQIVGNSKNDDINEINYIDKYSIKDINLLRDMKQDWCELNDNDIGKYFSIYDTIQLLWWFFLGINIIVVLGNDIALFLSSKQNMISGIFPLGLCLFAVCLIWDLSSKQKIVQSIVSLCIFFLAIVIAMLLLH